MSSATVAVLTYNGRSYIRAIIEAVLGQDYPEVELLIIDSGSTDGTLEIIREYPQVRLVEIPNSEFGHGRTRNLAAQLANGEYIAYLTHDAVPTTSSWLSRLIEPLETFPQVAGVLGKQIPRYDTFPLQKYDIEAVFAGQGPDSGVTVYRAANTAESAIDMGQVTFYSDVNSATRTSFLREQIPYRDVQYAEDQQFAKDFVAAGYWKAYAPLAAVSHSNDLSLREYGPRIFDEYVGLRRVGVELTGMTRLQVLRTALRGALGQQRTILRDGRFSWKRKLYWLVWNPLFHFARWSGYRRATLAALDRVDEIAAHSLEARKRAV